MTRPIGDRLFGFGAAPAQRRRTASELGLNEASFRDEVFKRPKLLIDARRAAGVTDDEWYPWARECAVGVGRIDVLLVSSQGRLAVLETKLSSNPESRRRVLAQTLDYLIHLPEALESSPPELPLDEGGAPVAELDDVLEAAHQGDVLLRW